MTNNDFVKSISLDGEVWKDISGYEGLYMCSSLGRIFACSKIFIFPNGGICEKGLRVLSTIRDKDGYLRVHLTKNKKSKGFAVHRLIAQEFLSNPNNYPCIDHINGIRDDNNVSNLRWCTNKQNCNFSLALINRSLGQRESYRKNPNRKDKLLDRNNLRKIGLYAYNLDGSFERFFESASDACKHVGGFIFHNLKKPIFYHKGYVFSKHPITDFSLFPYAPKTVGKQIFKIDEGGNIVMNYNSINDASIGEGVSKDKMRSLLRKGNKYNECYFRFK